MISLNNEDRSATGRRRTFHLLDAMRGVAAFAVAQRHTAWLCGTTAWPSTYLAVDLFFVLSGFVIAYSYEDRLRSGMQWSRFMRLRLIRLYPLYALGLVLGIAATAGRQLHSPMRTIDFPVLIEATFLALFFLPSWSVPALIGPRWTLTYELVANALYALAVRWLTPFLTAMIVVSAAGTLVASIAHYGTIDAGWALDQVPIALTRVIFSFGFGVFLFAMHRKVVPRWLVIMTWSVLAFLTLAVWVMINNGVMDVDLSLVMLGFPMLTLLGASMDVGGTAASICGVLGTTSYALYVIHQPAALLYEAVLKRALPAKLSLTPWAGWILLVGLIVVSWLLDRFYDTPVRKRLVSRFIRSDDKAERAGRNSNRQADASVHP